MQILRGLIWRRLLFVVVSQRAGWKAQDGRYRKSSFPCIRSSLKAGIMARGKLLGNSQRCLLQPLHAYIYIVWRLVEINKRKCTHYWKNPRSDRESEVCIMIDRFLVHWITKSCLFGGRCWDWWTSHSPKVKKGWFPKHQPFSPVIILNMISCTAMLLILCISIWASLVWNNDIFLINIRIH